MQIQSPVMAPTSSPVHVAPERTPLLDASGQPAPAAPARIEAGILIGSEIPSVVGGGHEFEEHRPPARSLLEMIVHAWNPKDNLASLIRRPRDALAPVDGLRAWAVIWVIMYHCLNYWRVKGQFNPQSAYNWQQFRDSHAAQVFAAGEMGVDIFFVLSGFLIAHQLIAEFTALRTVRGVRFLWRRWLRLVPVYLAAFPVYTLIPALNDPNPTPIGPTPPPPLSAAHVAAAMTGALGDAEPFPHQNIVCADWWWTNLLFVNNYVGPQDELGCLGHTWTIAVEFQFYLLSPAIVIIMLLPTAFSSQLMPWKTSTKKALGAVVPTLLILGCLIVRLVLLVSIEPRPAAGDPRIYNKTYTRCAPYLFGMLVALALHDPDKPSLLFGRSRARSFAADAGGDKETAAIVQSHPAYDYEAYTKEMEQIMNWPQHLRHFIFAFCWIALSYTGAAGQPNYPWWANLILHILARAFYGASVAYFLHMTLTDRAKFMRSILSWRIWIPFARLSYSAYVFQFLGLLLPCQVVTLDGASSLNAAFFRYLGLVAFALPCTFGIALISYLLIERPFMKLR